MKYYSGHAIFEGTVNVDGGGKGVPIVIKIQDEQGRQDGMVVIVHPEDVEHVRRALWCLQGVSKSALSEAMVKKFSETGLIEIPN